MPYAIENGMWRGVFAVPNDIVDLHLKLCGEVPLKVLLALLRYNGGMDAEALSAVVGKPVPMVREALEYWAALGVLKDATAMPAAETQVLQYEEVRAEQPAAAPLPAEKQADAPKERKIATISTERRRFERDEINRLAECDENIAGLLQEAQQLLGKTLGGVATDTIVALYSYYGMSPDLIMMVMQYCVGIGKANMRYIEKVAASWIENGIETHEQAEQEIRRQMERKTNEGKIMAAFGIRDRALVSSEKKYIQTWVNEFGLDIKLISLAYERCIELKAKLSFPYINGILANWHAKGITTPAEALRDTRESQAPKAAAQAANGSSYDLGELEEMLEQGAF